MLAGAGFGCVLGTWREQSGSTGTRMRLKKPSPSYSSMNGPSACHCEWRQAGCAMPRPSGRARPGRGWVARVPPGLLPCGVIRAALRALFGGGELGYRLPRLTVNPFERSRPCAARVASLLPGAGLARLPMAAAREWIPARHPLRPRMKFALNGLCGPWRGGWRGGNRQPKASTQGGNRIVNRGRRQCWRRT